jgi:riboflavin kinase/FMN adenylyltransferase
VDKIGTKHLVIGYDHRFGKNREGGFEELKANEAKYGFQVEEIPKQEIDDVSVSSTKIRNALLTGDIDNATNYLGRYYSITGKVVPGAKLGRKIGFPTANIEIKENFKLIPADGAYAIMAHIDGESFKGMMNIGIRPTVDGTKRTIEAHLFDFQDNIYGSSITISFVSSIRKETKFTDLDALQQQLAKDKEKAIMLLTK